MIEDVVVESVEGSYQFKVLRGNVYWGGRSARFTGVVYQSVGGPNVRAVLEEEDVEKLIMQGVPSDELIKLELELQQKIVNGEVRFGSS